MGYAAVYIPEFPVTAWLRSDATVRSYALAVIEGRPPLQRIVSLNGVAQSRGVCFGQSKVQAEATSPIVFRDRSMAEEQAAFAEVCTIAERFSPRVQVIASPPDELTIALLIDQTGTETLFGPAETYGRKLHAELVDAGFACNVAVALNANASLMFARQWGGTTFVEAKDTATRLAPLPLSLLPCGSSILRVLSRWGIRTLGELAALPPASLISRIGQQAERLQRLALGVEDHLLVPSEEVFTLAEHIVLDSALDQLESLFFIVSPMLEKIVRRAAERAYALRTITLTLKLDKAQAWTREIRPALPTQNCDLLLKLLNLDLQAHPPKAAILELTLSAEPAKPQTAQRGLFQSQFPESDKLDLLTARLRSIAGDANVGSPELCNSHRDDDFLMAPFRLRRFRPPQPARITMKNGMPGQLFWQGKWLEVTDAKGPWQSSGCWWDGRKWAAEEWDAWVTMPTQAMRLRHEVRSGAWTVTGVYD